MVGLIDCDHTGYVGVLDYVLEGSSMNEPL